MPSNTNKGFVRLWFSTNQPQFCYLFLWIHQSLSSSSLPWDINPRGISMTRNMKSKLAIKFPTPNEWSSNALPPVRLSWSNSLPPGQEKASNAWGMPGEGDGWGCRYISFCTIGHYFKSMHKEGVKVFLNCQGNDHTWSLQTVPVASSRLMQFFNRVWRIPQAFVLTLSIQQKLLDANCFLVEWFKQYIVKSC